LAECEVQVSAGVIKTLVQLPSPVSLTPAIKASERMKAESVMKNRAVTAQLLTCERERDK